MDSREVGVYLPNMSLIRRFHVSRCGFDGLLLERTSLRDQWEWAKQVVEILSLSSSSIGMEIACFSATEWRDVCRNRLNEIEARLVALGFREN